MRRQRDHRNVVVAALSADLSQKIAPAGVGQEDVHEHDRRRDPLPQTLPKLRAAAGDDDGMSDELEKIPRELEVQRVVFDDENVERHGSALTTDSSIVDSGHPIVNVVPLPSALSTAIVPFISSNKR